jgi:hypothetical protein
VGRRSSHRQVCRHNPGRVRATAKPKHKYLLPWRVRPHQEGVRITNVCREPESDGFAQYKLGQRRF